MSVSKSAHCPFYFCVLCCYSHTTVQLPLRDTLKSMFEPILVAMFSIYIQAVLRATRHPRCTHKRKLLVYTFWVVMRLVWGGPLRLEKKKTFNSAVHFLRHFPAFFSVLAGNYYPGPVSINYWSCLIWSGSRVSLWYQVTLNERDSSRYNLYNLWFVAS